MELNHTAYSFFADERIITLLMRDKWRGRLVSEACAYNRTFAGQDLYDSK